MDEVRQGASLAGRGGFGKHCEADEAVEANIASFNGQTSGALLSAHENVDNLLRRVRGSRAEPAEAGKTGLNELVREQSLMDQAVMARDSIYRLNEKLAELARYI